MAFTIPKMKIAETPGSLVVTLANSPLLAAVLAVFVTAMLALVMWFFGVSVPDEPRAAAVHSAALPSALDVSVFENPIFRHLTPYGFRPEVMRPESRNIFTFPGILQSETP